MEQSAIAIADPDPVLENAIYWLKRRGFAVLSSNSASARGRFLAQIRTQTEEQLRWAILYGTNRFGPEDLPGCFDSWKPGYFAMQYSNGPRMSKFVIHQSNLDSKEKVDFLIMRVIASIEHENCAICFDPLEYTSGKPIFALSTCGHLFHLGCLKRGLESNDVGIDKFERCPHCRSPFDTDDIERILNR